MRPSAALLLALVFGESCAGELRPFAPQAIVSYNPDVFDTEATVEHAAHEAMRHAIRWGAPTESPGRDLAPAAEEILNGNLVRVNLWSGDVTDLAVGVGSGAQCSPGVRLHSEVLYLCKVGTVLGPDFTLFHTVDGQTIRIEGGPSPARLPYSVSDDGGVNMGWGASPCRPKRLRQPVTMCDLCAQPVHYGTCVRSADGSGRSYLVEAAGAGGPLRFEEVRWVPRGDGAVALVVNAIDGKPESWGVVDGMTRALRRWATTPDADVRAALLRSTIRRSCPLGDFSVGDADTWLDRDWSLTATGSLLGWIRAGDKLGRVEIFPDGTAHRGPEVFEGLLPAGPVALGRAADGRVFQTLDHGLTWREVPAFSGAFPNPEPPQCVVPPEAPPLPPPPPVCSLVGCDLGGSIRIGWSSEPGARAGEPVRSSSRER
jgi:hypothetical protein